MNDLSEIIYLYVTSIIEILIGFYFFNRFLKRKISPLSYILFAMSGIVIIVICPSNGILQFCMYTLLFTVSGIVMAKAEGVLSFLYAVVIIEIMNLCYGIFNSLFSMLSPFVFTVNPEMVGYVFMTTGSILSLGTSVLCYKMIDRYLVDDKTGSEKYVIMILTPAILIALVSEYISVNVYGNAMIIEKDGKVLVSGLYQIFFIQLLSLASMFCILYAYKKLVKSIQLSSQVSLLEQESHFLNQYVAEAKVRYEKTKSFRHDIKNHLMVVKELLQNRNMEAALQYIGDMENVTSEISFPVHTNNPVLDVLLENKLGIARSHEIEVECSLTVPYPCTVNDMDFCIVLSNALDNAILACKGLKSGEEKYIHISGRLQGAFFLMEIGNSYSGTDIVQRGTGLSNIKAVAEKYHGAIEIRTKEESFVLSVLFIIPQQSDNTSQQMD